MDNIIDFLQAWWKDRQSKAKKKRSWKEYWQEKKRLWTDTEEYKKIFTIETWKKALLVDVPQKLWKKLRWKIVLLIVMVLLGLSAEYVGRITGYVG